MDEDGTLIFDFIADDNDAKGEARLIYKKNDPDYGKALKHVEPLNQVKRRALCRGRIERIYIKGTT